MFENIIEPVSSPSTRVRLRYRLALWPVVLLVLAALVFTALLFAAGARASGTAPSGATDAPIGEAATNGATSSEQPTISIGEQSPPTTEQTTTAAETSPPVAEATPPPVVEATPPPVVEATPPPVVETTPPPVEQAPPVAVESPPTVEQPRPVAEEPASVVDKKTTEQTTGDVATTGFEAVQGSGEGTQAPVDTSGSTHRDAAGEDAGEVAPGAAAAVTTSATPAVLSEVSMPSLQDLPSLAFPPPPAQVHSAGQTSCELAALGTSIAVGYAHGLLDISAATPVSTLRLAAVEASPTATTTGGSDGGEGGSAVDHPTSPTPGPGSGGAGSGSAAGGGSGSASSAPFTLVGALLQAAPRAMRRLLLAQQSWRTSVLVLIPERPD